MTKKQAVNLLEKAVKFYIQQNYEFSANLHKNENEDLARQEMRDALDMAKQALMPRQTRMEI